MKERNFQITHSDIDKSYQVSSRNTKAISLKNLVELYRQELKRENKQFWGRQLGMCWQLLVVELCRHTCADYGGA